MKLTRGSTSRILSVWIGDSRSNAGAGLTGLVYNSSGLAAYYKIDNAGSAVAVTLVSTSVGLYTSGGFKEVDATNLPGWYEIGVPNAALASGKLVTLYLSGAANMVPSATVIELDALDYQDAQRAGLSALPNANPGFIGGLLAYGTGPGQINLTGSSGIVPADVQTIKGQAVTATGAFSFDGQTTAQTTLAGILSGSNKVRAFDANGNALATHGDEQTTQSAIAALTTNTVRASLGVPSTILLPAAGTQVSLVTLDLYTANGIPEAPDALPTVAVVNAAGVDRSAKLGTVTSTGDTGGYTVTYTAAVGDPVEELIFTWRWAVGGVASRIRASTATGYSYATDFTATDRATLAGRLASADYVAPLSSASTQAATAAALTSYAAAKQGDAMALTTGERTTLFAGVWAFAASGATVAGSVGKRLIEFVGALVYQGPPTQQQIADALKFAPTAGAPAAGSAMDRLDDKVSSRATQGDVSVSGGFTDADRTKLTSINTNNPGPGPGPYAVTITVTDGAAALQGARVTYTQAGVIRGTRTTDASGVAVLSLPAGTYTRNVYLTGYNGSTVAHNFAGEASAAVTLAPLVVAPPADPGQTTAYGITRTAKGAAVPSVTVYFELLDPSGVSIWQRSATAVSDGAGLLQVPLAKSSKYRASLDKRLWTTFTTGATDTFALPEILQGVDR